MEALTGTTSSSGHTRDERSASDGQLFGHEPAGGRGQRRVVRRHSQVAGIGQFMFALFALWLLLVTVVLIRTHPPQQG